MQFSFQQYMLSVPSTDTLSKAVSEGSSYTHQSNDKVISLSLSQSLVFICFEIRDS
ncbi:hypothetical protein Syun_019681 [Stephania yunnanensis]|uniref:Uncharacterized protein n=1 Tax=Stephania yunnanensis TaxID=152371 RepID=A0AAP0NXN0_9MAGN